MKNHQNNFNAYVIGKEYEWKCPCNYIIGFTNTTEIYGVLEGSNILSDQLLAVIPTTKTVYLKQIKPQITWTGPTLSSLLKKIFKAGKQK